MKNTGLTPEASKVFTMEEAINIRDTLLFAMMDASKEFEERSRKEYYIDPSGEVGVNHIVDHDVQDCNYWYGTYQERADALSLFEDKVLKEKYRALKTTKPSL